MDPCRYHFRTLWDLDAEPDAVHAVLEDVAHYPDWWPQVRGLTRVDDVTAELRFRSLLPYELVVTARETRRDARARVLEIAMRGDLEGWARWSLTERPPGGTRALYEQRVEVRKPLMRRLARPGRPFFLVNHAWMMRSGRRGLTARLQAV